MYIYIYKHIYIYIYIWGRARLYVRWSVSFLGGKYPGDTKLRCGHAVISLRACNHKFAFITNIIDAYY